jgi:LacI family transcriptional regulator
LLDHEVTIKDVAMRAGVSVATVSRIIGGTYPVSQETREKVKAVMEEMHFLPNAMAQSLRNRRSNMVALVVADLTNSFFMGVAKGLEATVAQMGLSLVVASSNGSVEKERQLIDTLVERRMDGIVLAPVDKDAEKTAGCARRGIPLVLIDRTIEGIDTNQVLWNDQESAYDLTRLLISRGHRRIGIINVSLKSSSGLERLSGFKKALEDASLPFIKEYSSRPNFSHREAYDSVMAMLSLPTPPTALFCANNVMVDGALQAAAEKNLLIYDDLSLVGFGNLECNRYVHPRITSACQDSMQMGEQAGNILLRLVQHKVGSTTKIILQTTIQEGESVRTI